MSKGSKPRKPQSKKTLTLLEQLRRNREVRELARRFLIVCEDDKSAPNYFEALKRHFRLTATSIQVVGSGGASQPIQVVNRAVDLSTEAAKPNSATIPFDEVWCVIDGDYGAKINNARAKAKKKKIELAISTPCFEYWLLLHFEANATPAEKCDTVVHLLKKRHVPQYEKGKYEFGTIMESVRIACKRAEQVRKPGITGGDQPEEQNPCTEIYKLINNVLGGP